MIDPNTLSKEMKNKKTMQTVKRLAESEDVAALAKTIDQNALRSAAEKQNPSEPANYNVKTRRRSDYAELYLYLAELSNQLLEILL